VTEQKGTEGTKMNLENRKAGKRHEQRRREGAKETTLAACPFCGSAAFSCQEESADELPAWAVRCNRCDAAVVVEDGDWSRVLESVDGLKLSAEQQWNRRTSGTPLPASAS
jgi:transcription elongation factor Elf1